MVVFGCQISSEILPTLHSSAKDYPRGGRVFVTRPTLCDCAVRHVLREGLDGGCWHQ